MKRVTPKYLAAATALLLAVAAPTPRAAAQEVQPSNAQEHAPVAPASAGTNNTALPGDDKSLGDLSLVDLMSIDLDVYTATKTKSSLKEAPAIISVVTREDIASRQFDSIADVLHHTMGFYVIDDFVLPNVGVRGIPGGLFGESGNIKVMVDGHSVAFRSTAGNWLGPELVPLTAVERIEIIRGPASALYGADAYLGVVNIITRKGGDVAGADVRMGAGVPATGKLGSDVDVTAGTTKGPVEVLVGARVNQQDYSGLELPDTSPAPNLPSYSQADPTTSGMLLESRAVFGRVSYELSDTSTLSLTGQHSRLGRVAEFSSWTQLAHGLDEDGRLNQTRVDLERNQVGLTVDSQPSEELGLTLKSSLFSGGPTDDDRIEVGSSTSYIRRDFGYMGGDASFEARWVALPEVQVVGGVEGMFDREDLQSNLYVLKTSSESNSPGEIVNQLSAIQGTRDFYNVGSFLQLLHTPVERYLTLTGGMRFDYHNIYGSKPSGRLGVVSQPLARTYVKLLYGTAFKAPSPKLLHSVPIRAGDVVGNPDLKPQQVHTVEGQVTYQEDYFVASTGLAYNILLNQAEFSQQGLNKIARNTSRMSSVSWESELAVQYRDKIRSHLGFELQGAVRDLGDAGSYQTRVLGDQPGIYPHYIVRYGARAPLPLLPVRANAEVMYVAERRSSDTNTMENGAVYTLPSYMLLRAGLSTTGLELFDGHESAIVLSGTNLLGAGGPDPGFAGVDYPLRPRTVFLQLRQEL